MPPKHRGEFVDLTEQINLTIQFKNSAGVPTDTDTFPQISIIQPNGLVLLSPTSNGVSRIATGKYQYTHTVGINGPYGVYNDIWIGYVNGFRVESTFSFVVAHTEMPAINTDGYVALGDDPGFHYSQNAIMNINKLIKALKARLNSAGKVRKTDANGNITYVSCDIFSIESLVNFLAIALSDFNQVPYFTTFTFEDTDFIAQFLEILVEGATLYALASKALIERGAEFQITDNGINFNPPSVSELLNTQYNTLLTHYWDKLRYVKNSMRPFPKALGTFSMTSGSLNPAVRRLRHLRARQII